jgi:hypothetical protein
MKITQLIYYSLVVLFLLNTDYICQRNYRLMIPGTSGHNTGKAPEDGGDFLYLNLNNNYYFINSSDLTA